MDFMSEMKDKAKTLDKSVVFPESDDDRILQASEILLKEGLARPILVGDPDKVMQRAKNLGIDLKNTKVYSSQDPAFIEELTKSFDYSCGLTPKEAKRLFSEPLYCAAQMVKNGMADIMVAGLSCTTAEVVLASQSVIGLEEGIHTPSSLFLMRIPGYQGPEGEYLIFADCAVLPAPTSDELADIALTTARTAQRLLGWEPRVAMISFSTKGSSVHPVVNPVLDALKIAHERDPQLLIDGEMQVDAAIVPEVAAKKVPGGSPVAGRANILVFPDLNTANAAYKLVQRLARADAYGPLLQGFAKPVSDLSRGASVDDIVGAVVMTVARSVLGHQVRGAS